MSSRKLHAGKTLGDDGEAKDTRLALDMGELGCEIDAVEDAGYPGALKENVVVLGGPSFFPGVLGCGDLLGPAVAFVDIMVVCSLESG